MPDARRVILRDGNGEPVRVMDLSDIENADLKSLMTLAIETRCELGDWHLGESWLLAPFLRAIPASKESEQHGNPSDRPA